MAKSAKAVKEELTSDDNPFPVALPAGARVVKLPEGVKIKRHVTLPSLTLKRNEPRILFFVSEMRISQVKGKKKPDGTYEEPAIIADVGDIETGEQLILLVPTVVKKNLEEMYPSGEYKGKTFFIENLGKKKDGQRYNDFQISEVETEAE